VRDADAERERKGWALGYDRLRLKRNVDAQQLHPEHLNRKLIDYLFITNADQAHMSDLAALDAQGIGISTAILNRSYTGDKLRAIKGKGGPLSDDANWFASMCETYTHPMAHPFNRAMGGITYKSFWNSYPDFTDTNNLSLVVFVSFGTFTVLFPGDLEKAGWLALLQNAEFRGYLAGVTILIASHHGRESGFCPEVFDYCNPRAVVISDKSIVHSTQEMVPNVLTVLATIFLSQYLVCAVSARWAEIRFVCNVLAIHCKKVGAGE
jgi:beta-lactamase superfamily II metal-dependent hydrolase